MARKTFGWGLIAVMPFYLMEDAAPVEALTDPVSAALLVFLAVGPTTLCTLLWQRAAREAGAQQIRNLLFLIPVIAMIAGLVILDESVTFIGVMGAAMILCGVWCSDLGMKRVNAVLAGADADALSAKDHALVTTFPHHFLQAAPDPHAPRAAPYPHESPRPPRTTLSPRHTLICTIVSKTREGSKIHMGRDPNHLPETLT